MIKLNNINKYFYKGKENEIHVISNTSLELPNNGLISFLGSSGSGKTTLLNVIGGLDKATGDFQYDDIKIKNYNMHNVDLYRNKNIGYVFQNYNLILEETVYDNLKIALEIIGIKNPEEVNKRIEYALKSVGMFKYRKKQALALSGGQQQRVSIARALVKQCKIIIADEPTGNLDSENTIEVMNILKKISNTSLVLLVTHDQNIASFYSDFIYEIQDGKIINQSFGENDKKLINTVNNAIYLKDMNEVVQTTPIGDISIYSDEEPEVLDLSVIFKNGSIYINTNKPVKLISDTNVKLINDHYHPTRIEDIDDSKFDISWYDDKKTSFSFKRIINGITSTFAKFKNVKRSMKLLYSSLFLLGCILAISIISYSNANSVDTDDLSYNDVYYSLYNDKLNKKEEALLEEMLDKGIVNYAVKPVDVDMQFYHVINLIHQISIEQDIMLLYYNDKQAILKGDKPNEWNEILISQSTADYILECGDGYLSYDELIGKNIKLTKSNNSENFKICGITCGNDQGYCYINKDYFYYFQWESSEFAKAPSYRLAENEKYSTGESVYTVVKGRDVDINSVYNEVLVSDALYSYLSFKDDFNIADCQTIKINSNKYYIVGTYSYPYKLTNEMFIFNKNSKISSSLQNEIAVMSKEEYTIIEGKDVENNDEIIIPSYIDLEIGQVYRERRIVGKYTGSTLAFSYNGIMTQNSHALYYYNDEVLLDVNDIELAEEIAISNGCDILDTFAEEVKIKKNIDDSTFVILRLLFIILFIVVIVFVYFIMRTKMIADIYNIGVLRCLGATRLQLIRRYLGESIILTVFTSLLGYVLTLAIYSLLAQKLFYFFFKSFFPVNIMHSLLGGIALFIIMIIFGMLPILLLLRKTPSEICSKYDI